MPLSTRIRNHIRRNFYGLVAIFIALGGTATASHLVVQASDIKKNAVRAKHIKRGAVKKPKLAARSVTNLKLALGAVTTSSLADDAVISTKVVDGSLGGADIANGSIGLSDLGANSVNSSKVVDSSLTGADLGANSVNSSKVVDSSLTGADINEGTLDLDLQSVVTSSGNNSNSPKRIFPLVCPPGKFVLDVGAQIHGGTSGASPNALSEVVITELVSSGTFAAVTAYETDAFAGNWRLEAGILCARIAG